ncbi:MAG: hypothetical protein HC895_07405 [Leptolyngbyaceae cyanobacterium SM1_3_5]|nr:hypothetical protein [Leptolyngbyaceae cyanobacterium SM1_3_5]
MIGLVLLRRLLHNGSPPSQLPTPDTRSLTPDTQKHPTPKNPVDFRAIGVRNRDAQLEVTATRRDREFARAADCGGRRFAVVNLDRKVYWADEAYTSLRISGFTEREFIRDIYTGDRVTVADLQRYQHPNAERTWADAFRAFRGNAEHSPLYFILARSWVLTFGSSIATIRTLSACISLFAFPALYWLCQELFASRTISIISLAFLAVSPLHILYAQEARQYSLWTVATLFSCAALLWAMRTQTRRSWIIFALSIALGFYSHLLFGLVAIAQATYVFLSGKRSQSQCTRLCAEYDRRIHLFVPWLTVAFMNLERIQRTTASLNLRQSLSYVFDRWF